MGIIISRYSLNIVASQGWVLFSETKELSRTNTGPPFKPLLCSPRTTGFYKGCGERADQCLPELTGNQAKGNESENL